MNKIALVVGVSSSGKDYYLEKVLPFLPAGLKVVNFGEEVFKHLQLSHPKIVHRDQLRDLDSREIRDGNMKVGRWLVENQPVIVNTHMVISMGVDLVIIPESIYTMSPEMLIHVSAPVEDILSRREFGARGRKEFTDSTERISLHQELSVWLTRKLARQIGSSFVEISNRLGSDETNLLVLRGALSSFH